MILGTLAEGCAKLLLVLANVRELFRAKSLNKIKQKTKCINKEKCLNSQLRERYKIQAIYSQSNSIRYKDRHSHRNIKTGKANTASQEQNRSQQTLRQSRQLGADVATKRGCKTVAL